MYIACKISKNEITQQGDFCEFYNQITNYALNEIKNKISERTPPKNKLDKYFIDKLENQTILSGEQIIQDNFPNSINANVFISHSHYDKTYALFLKSYLKKNFNLNCFIDSLVWHNAFDLLKNVDEYFSIKR